MNRYLTQLDFTTLDYIFANNSAAYCEYLDACDDALRQADQEINSCFHSITCDQIGAIRHRIQPNLDLLGLIEFKDDLIAFETGTRESTDALFKEIHETFPLLSAAIAQKKESLK
jgi:hypothetical protein